MASLFLLPWSMLARLVGPLWPLSTPCNHAVLSSMVVLSFETFKARSLGLHSSSTLMHHTMAFLSLPTFLSMPYLPCSNHHTPPRGPHAFVHGFHAPPHVFRVVARSSSTCLFLPRPLFKLLLSGFFLLLSLFFMYF
jgi:hypothetical protein